MLASLGQCQNGTIRLSGGNITAGKVELCLNNTWGAVCDDGWDRRNAEVACRQLRLPFSGEYFTKVKRDAKFYVSWIYIFVFYTTKPVQCGIKWVCIYHIHKLVIPK